MSNLQPGPELDALIATKVCEWHADHDGIFDVWCRADDVVVCAHCDFHPTTNLGDCQHVIDALVAQGKTIEMFVYAGYSGVTIGEHYAEAPTLPAAICLAALKAVEK